MAGCGAYCFLVCHCYLAAQNAVDSKFRPVVSRASVIQFLGHGAPLLLITILDFNIPISAW